MIYDKGNQKMLLVKRHPFMEENELYNEEGLLVKEA
jgi:hypothetical protein